LQNGKCRNWTLSKHEKLNHLFQTSKTGSVAEYEKLEETFSEDVLKEMVDWIKDL